MSNSRSTRPDGVSRRRRQPEPPPRILQESEQQQGHDEQPTCRTCYKTFSRSRDLDRHLRTVHRPPGTGIQCPDCGLLLARRDNVRRHRGNQQCRHRLRFGQQSCNMCWACNKVFHSKNSLMRHQIASHKRRMECSVCGEVFLNQSCGFLLEHRGSASCMRRFDLFLELGGFLASLPFPIPPTDVNDRARAIPGSSNEHTQSSSSPST
ncbi:hypothetical protein BDB00DRAFT_794084 [Zychaea mexicana]|uniref:uncharacterized protein n=1 Tax=Zychaea mexicana TaxID=64656 RepID=UPI0022FF1F1B|nr:uncharacterized protein BDB00DRAFT_794084 [Zychaea mexicana]KAI9499470.1 hypothetical protein BDB00DRAFT_794084 [Zychaea mexicana]